jgi:hypothetical protein
MILYPESSSSNRTGAIDELVGAGFSSNGAAFFSNAANAQQRMSAAIEMRHRLYLLDPSERRLSIEDCVAAVLEQSTGTLQA